MPGEGACDPALDAAKKYRQAERGFEKKLESSNEWEKKELLKEREAEKELLKEMDEEAIAEMKQFRRWLNNEQRKLDSGGITKQGTEDLMRWTKNPKYFVEKLSVTEEGKIMEPSAAAARDRFQSEKFDARMEQGLDEGLPKDWWDYYEGYGKRVKRVVVGKDGVERVVRGRERRKGKFIDGKVVWIGKGEEERMVKGRIVRVAKGTASGNTQMAKDGTGEEVEGIVQKMELGLKDEGKKVYGGNGDNGGFGRIGTFTLPLRSRRLRVDGLESGDALGIDAGKE
ncbi:MAG: hypothetical protein Q9201_001295 [Fulgogasparrea decipioides]